MASQGVISILSHPSQPCGCESLKEEMSYVVDRLQNLDDEVGETSALALQNRYALKGDMDVSFLQKPGAEKSLSYRMVVTETQVGGLSERVASLETVSHTLAAQQEVVNKKLALLKDATQPPACKCPSVEHIRDFVQSKVDKVDERVTALRKRVAHKFDTLQEFCVQGFATAQRGVSREEMVRELARRQEGMMEVMRREVEEQRSRTAAEEWQVQAENGRRFEDVEEKVGHVAQEVHSMRRREWEREAHRGATAGYAPPTAGYGGQGYGESWQGAGASQWGNTPGVAQGTTLGVEIGGGEGGRGAQGREGQGASSPPLHPSTSATTGQGLQGLDGGEEKGGGRGGLWGVKVGVGLGVMGLLAIAVSLMVGLEGHSLMVKEGADPSYMTSYSGAKVWGDMMGDFKLNVNLKENFNSALTAARTLLPDVQALKSKVNFNFNVNVNKTPGDKTQGDDVKVSGPSVQASGTRPEATHHHPTASTDVTTHADTSKAPAPAPTTAPQQSEVEVALDGPAVPPNGEVGFVVLAPGKWDDAAMQQDQLKGPHDKPEHAQAFANLKGQEDTAPQAPPTTPTGVQAPAMHNEGPDGEAPEGELTFGEAQSREAVQERPEDERDGAMEGRHTPRGQMPEDEPEEEGHGGTHDQPMEEEGDQGEEEQGEEHGHWEGQDRGEGDGEAAHGDGDEGGDGGEEEEHEDH